jgi:hypothetical protein
MTPYQFAILRYVHSAVTEEFVNVGVLLWLPNQQSGEFRANDRYARLSGFFRGFDGPGYRYLIRHLVHRFEEFRAANAAVGSRLDMSDVLAALVPLDASVFQWSTVMGGIADDPSARLDQLFVELVERFEIVGARGRRDEAEIWTSMERGLSRRGLLGSVESGIELEAPDYRYRFKAGWMNGRLQVMEPISLDYINGTDVVEKANSWGGRLLNLARGSDFALTGVVSLPTRSDLTGAVQQAIRILSAAPRVRQIVTEDRFDQVMDDIERDIARH